MEKFRINITDGTSTGDVLNKFKKECARLGLSGAQEEKLVEETRTIVEDLATRGKKVASFHSSFEVTREIISAKCKVCVHARFGFGCSPPSIYSRIKALLFH